MALQLLHRPTNTLRPLNRGDNTVPLGLDRSPSGYYVVEVIHLEPPELQPGEQAIPAQPVINITDPDGQGINGTVALGWEVIPAPPPPPLEPDWNAFREGLRTENGYQTYFAQASQLQPLTATSLPVDFYEFRTTGNYDSFLNLLIQVISLLPPQDGANALSELIQLSQRCHMPQAFINDLLQLV